jgi:hypothetical protein
VANPIHQLVATYCEMQNTFSRICQQILFHGIIQPPFRMPQVPNNFWHGYVRSVRLGLGLGLGFIPMWMGCWLRLLSRSQENTN